MSFLSWISRNYKWLFDGVGVVALGWILKIIFEKSSISQKQTSGRNSINIQSGGNIDLTKSSIKNDSKNELTKN
jgi:hypothetical protein